MVQFHQQVRLVGLSPGDPLVQLIVTRHRGKQFVELLSPLRRPLRRWILPVHEQLFVEIPVALPECFQPCNDAAAHTASGSDNGDRREIQHKASSSATRLNCLHRHTLKGARARSRRDTPPGPPPPSSGGASPRSEPDLFRQPSCNSSPLQSCWNGNCPTGSATRFDTPNRRNRSK